MNLNKFLHIIYFFAFILLVALSSPETTYSQAVELDGEDDVVRTANSVVPPESYEIKLWFKTESPEGGVMIGANETQDGDSGVGDRRIYLNSSGQIYFGVFTSDVRTVSSSDSYNDGKWHRVVASQSSDGMRLYVDGELVGSNSVSESEMFEKFWSIGYSRMRADWPSRPSSYYFDGIVDEVEVYDKSSKEVDSRWEFDFLEDLGVGGDGVDDVRDVSGGTNHADLESGAALVFFPPQDVSAAYGDGQVHLNWESGGVGSPAGFNVYRATSSFSNVGSATQLNDEPIRQKRYADLDVELGKAYYYRVTAVGKNGQESNLSEEVNIKPVSSEFFVWPVDEPQISQDYATFNSGVSNRYHLGIDLISANESLDVYSAAEGEVVLEGKEDDAYGTYMVVDHGNNLYALYAHLSSKKDLETLEQGERLGTMGKSGDARGVHLHFDVMASSSKPSSVEEFDNGYHTGHPSQLGHPDPKTYLQQRYAQVTTETTGVREGPSSSSSLVGGQTTIELGQEFVSIGPAVNGWHLIYIPYNVTPSTSDDYYDFDRYGWVDGEAVEMGTANRTRLRINGEKIASEDGSGKYLNVRSSPSESSSTLTKVWGGQRFVTIGSPVDGSGSEEPWYQIHLPEKAGSTEGWVAGDFVKIINPALSNTLAAVTKTVSSDGMVDFETTGINIAFSGVSGSGDVEVVKVEDAAIGSTGLVENNVSNYRFTIKAEDQLEFGSGTEVEFEVPTLAGVGDGNQVDVYKRSKAGQGMFESLPSQFNAEDEVLSATIDDFSEFVLASNTEPLPVELLGFEATAVDESKVRLTWKTGSESNNARFEVQRKAEERGLWTSVGSVEGSGTTNRLQEYRFADRDLPYEADRLTYRLKQIDTDGSARFSDKVTVKRDLDGVELIGPHPNPARNRTTVKYASPEKQEVVIRLYDLLGRRVQTVVSSEQSGRHQHRVDVSELASGVYFLRFKTGELIRTRKLTVAQ
jgi:hypothetical protein